MTLEPYPDDWITEGLQLFAERPGLRGRGQEPVHQNYTQFLSPFFGQEQERLTTFRGRLLLVDFLIARSREILLVSGVSSEFVVKAHLRQGLVIQRGRLLNRPFHRTGDSRNGCDFVRIDCNQVL